MIGPALGAKPNGAPSSAVQSPVRWRNRAATAFATTTRTGRPRLR
jgi:hypothetical protein